MDFQKVSDAIKNSSPEIKNLMFSNELSNKATDIAFDNNLDEEVFLRFIDEIGYVILGIKPRNAFSSSLTEIGIEKEAANKIASEIESQIFSLLDEIKKAPNPTTPIQSEPEVKEKKESFIKQPIPESNIGNSFEQIILNQAKAMQPARPADEAGRDTRGEIPENLPTEQNEPIKEEPRAIHNYIGNDPYREPTE